MSRLRRTVRRWLSVSAVGAAQVTGNRRLIDASLNATRQALADAGTAKERVLLLKLQGVAWQRSFQGTGGIHDLDRAVEAFEEAAALLPDDDPDLPMVLQTIGESRLKRVDVDGTPDGLDEVFAVAERGWRLMQQTAAPPGKAGWSCLSVLVTAHRIRFDRHGDPVDLQAALDRAGELLRFAGPNRLQRALAHMGRGEVLTLGYAAGVWGLDALEMSVQAYRAVLDGPWVPVGGAVRLGSMIGLATSLRLLAERAGSVEDQEDQSEAASLLREVLRRVPSGHPDRPLALAGLAQISAHLHRLTGDDHHLTQAIGLAREALAAGVELGAGPRLLGVLASMVQQRHEVRGSAADLDEALRMLVAAHARLPEDHPLRIEMALGRSELLAGLSGLGSEMAACGLAAGRVGDAVVWLEQSRGVLWGQALDLRASGEVERLRRVDPALAGAFGDVAGRLEALSGGRP